jgi:hypothetical protein
LGTSLFIHIPILGLLTNGIGEKGVREKMKKMMHQKSL